MTPPISRHDIEAMMVDIAEQTAKINAKLDERIAEMTPARLPYKPVFRGRRRIGLARSWGEVAQLIGDKRQDAAGRLSRENVEGPDSFILKEKK